MWKRSLNQLVQEFKNEGNDVTNPRKRYAELVMVMVMVMTMVLMVAALMTLKSGGKPLESCKKGGEA